MTAHNANEFPYGLFVVCINL